MTEGTLKVIVHYAAAKKPYEQDHVSRNETVGTLKTNVLNAFGLKEGQHTDGNTYRAATNTASAAAGRISTDYVRCVDSRIDSLRPLVTGPADTDRASLGI
jgi:hypothetical protein